MPYLISRRLDGSTARRLDGSTARRLDGSAARRLGRYGDYAIASLMKFIPVYEGGCLVSEKRSLADLEMRNGGMIFQLRSALNVIELACQYGRLPWLGKAREFKDWLWSIVKSYQSRDKEADAANEGTDEFGSRFDIAGLNKTLSLMSLLITKGVSYSKSCELRRANYRILLEAFSNIPGGRPLYPGLPDGVVPYVFPMIIDDPDGVFAELKGRGVPIIRFGEYLWEGVNESICSVAADYSRRVFQFPCHQSLTSQELDWMIDTVSMLISRK